MATEERTCICGCGRTFTVDTGRRGRPRRYFADSCRSSAYRDRLEAAEFTPAVDVSRMHLQVDPGDIQIERAVVEAAAIAVAFAALASDNALPPKLAAGCERMAATMLEALDRFFPGWSR